MTDGLLHAADVVPLLDAAFAAMPGYRGIRSFARELPDNWPLDPAAWPFTLHIDIELTRPQRAQLPERYGRLANGVLMELHAVIGVMVVLHEVPDDLVLHSVPNHKDSR